MTRQGCVSKINHKTDLDQVINACEESRDVQIFVNTRDENEMKQNYTSTYIIHNLEVSLDTGIVNSRFYVNIYKL